VTIERKTIIDLHQVSGIGDETSISQKFTAIYYPGVIYFAGMGSGEKHIEHERVYYEAQKLEAIEEDQVYGGTVIIFTPGWGFRISQDSHTFPDKLPRAQIKEFDQVLIDYLKAVLVPEE